VNLWSVLEHHHLFALVAGEPEFRDRRTGVPEQPLLVRGIDPGAGDDARAVARPDLGFERVDDPVERLSIDEPLFDEQRLERLDAQRRVGRNHLVFVILVRVTVVRIGRERCGAGRRRLQEISPADRILTRHGVLLSQGELYNDSMPSARLCATLLN
jgi:hypothetical protein